MAFVTDTFSGGSDVALTSHAGEVGATWAQIPTTFGSIRVSAAGRAYPAAAQVATCYPVGTPASAEYDVAADVVCLSTSGLSGLSLGVGGRYSTSDETGYLVRTSGTQWGLLRGNSGSFTSLGTFNQTLAAGTTYALKLEIRNSAKKVYIDGVAQITSADNSIASTGVPVLRGVVAGGGTATAGVHLDNFTAADPGGSGVTFALAASVAALTPALSLSAGTPAARTLDLSPTLADLAAALGVTVAAPGSATLDLAAQADATASLSLSASGAGPSALLTDLAAYWTLDEPSGTRADSHGANDLAPTNAPGSAAGVMNDSAAFVRTSGQYLSCPDSAGLSTGDVDFTVSAWVYLESDGYSGGIALKGDGSGCEWMLFLNSFRFSLQVYSAAGFSGLTQLDHGDTVSPGTWYHVVAWHDSVNDEIGIAVNAGTPATTARSTGCFDSGAPFRIGSYPELPWPLDGRVDEVGFWKRVLTSQERADLYNGGAGLAYPFGAASGATLALASALEGLGASLTVSAGTPAASDLALAGSVSDLAPDLSLAAAAPGASTLALAGPIADLTASLDVSASAAGSASLDLAAPLADLTPTLSLATAAPASTTLDLAATAGLTASLSLSALAAGGIGVDLAGTLADLAGSLALSAAGPAAATLALAATADASAALSLLAAAPGARTVDLAAAVADLGGSLGLATSAPSGATLALAATLADAGASLTLTVAGPAAQTLTIAAALGPIAAALTIGGDLVAFVVPTALSAAVASAGPIDPGFTLVVMAGHLIDPDETAITDV